MNRILYIFMTHDHTRIRVAIGQIICYLEFSQLNVSSSNLANSCIKYKEREREYMSATVFVAGRNERDLRTYRI